MTIDQIATLVTDREIRDLAIRYSIAVDDGDLPTILECFTQEGGFERAGQAVRGQEALKSFFEGMVDRYALTRHVVEMQIVDPLVEPDRASGMVSGNAELVFGDTLYKVAYRYSDLYEREQDRWRFANRQLRFIYYLPAKELIDTIAENTRVRIPGTEPAPSEHLG
jgi:ketosteroid isomerase-like protein